MNNHNPTPTPRTDTQPSTPHLVSNYETIRKSNKKKLVWGLICLAGPTLLIIGAIALYAIVNLIALSIGQPSSDMLETASPMTRALNIILFILGVLGTLTWLPGIIGGIVLLATRRKLPPHQE